MDETMTTRNWNKAAICTMLAAGLLLSPLAPVGGNAVSAAAAQQQSIQLWLDDQNIQLSAPVYKENGVVMAPMKDLLDKLGVTSVYETKTGTIIIRDFDLTISMTVGGKGAIVNGASVQAPAAPAVKSGVVFIPVRFIAEQLYLDVIWDGAIHAVKLETWDYSLSKEEEVDDETDWIGPDTEAALTAEDIAAMFDESVVMIMTNKSQGSGVVIGDNLILTNYHVIADASSATAYSIYSDEIKIKGVAVWNENADLAIITTEDPIDLSQVSVDYAPISKGGKVYAIGSPQGVQNTISEGIVSNLHYEDGVRYLQTNAPIDHGSSGGALFDAYGNLVGITTSGYSNTQAHLNFAVSILHASVLYETATDSKIKDAAFFDPKLPDTLVGAPLSTIEKLLKEEFGSVLTNYGEAEFSNWEAKRDGEGWLVLSATIDPRFYIYNGTAAEAELRLWSINLGHELHRMLPKERIQVKIDFVRDYSFRPRGFASDEVTQIEGGKWRLRHFVIDMQLQDQMYLKTRF
ncbi:trypsin-like peptidase domain-containing protein [Paenibacillus sp. CAU 1782]